MALELFLLKLLTLASRLSETNVVLGFVFVFVLRHMCVFVLFVRLKELEWDPVKEGAETCDFLEARAAVY